MYAKSKIYKLQHDDGYFYIGSTVNELRKRLRQHKDNIHPNQRVYKHIAGEWDKVRIVLIEEFSCENKEQLRRKEDEYIQKELNNPLCLNTNHAVLNVEKRKANDIIKSQVYREEHPDHFIEYYIAHQEEIQNKRLQYYHDNKERINARRRELRQRKKSKE